MHGEAWLPLGPSGMGEGNGGGEKARVERWTETRGEYTEDVMVDEGNGV